MIVNLMEDGALILTIYKPKEYLQFKPVEMSKYELLLGYNQDGYIIADMRNGAHLLISGLSGNGKSKMVHYMLKNIQNKADILVLNGFEEDYQGFTLITGLKAIESHYGGAGEKKQAFIYSH